MIIKIIISFLSVALLLSPVSACTTMIVGKNASDNGSVMVAHSDDDELLGQRIVYIPAMDHKAGGRDGMIQRFPAAAIVSLLFAGLAGAGLSGHIRSFYLNRNYSTPISQESLAVGCWLQYDTPAWRGMSWRIAGR